MIDFESLPNDFEVSYRFYSPGEGGRKGPAFQGYRCDWIYADRAEAQPDQVWMIWPLFVYNDGEFVPENCKVPGKGTARMMIVNRELAKSIHKERIRIGVRGFFVEGQRKVAEATVTRVVDLGRNH